MIVLSPSSRAHRPIKACPRPAFSLLEVVLALAIFLLSLVAIGQIVSLASDQALEVQQQDQANLLCQSKLAEVLVGAEPLASSSGLASFAENPDWQWRMECEPAEFEGLWNVKVWVQYERLDGKRIEARLSQIVLDPSLRGSTMDKPASAAASSSSPAPSTSSTPTGGTTP
jgi:type II secretion system protein I